MSSVAKENSLQLLISEIYPSIQGESSFAGLPCVFVRLTGCPLRCSWCDTEYAFTGGTRMSLGDVLNQVKACGVNLVEVTGGEPLAQPECPTLLARLCDAGYEVLLETSGAIDVSPVDRRVVKIVDVKCPGSGEAERNLWSNLSALGPRDEIKFVLASRNDYNWAKQILIERGLTNRAGLLFSSAHGLLHPAELAGWIAEDRLNVRLQIQLHKYLWPDRSRGV